VSYDSDEFAAIYRREVGRCTATLVRVLGNVDLAEDAVADAFTVAAERWPIDGIPPNPGGWITTTARNRAIDRIRRESTRAAREQHSMTIRQQDSDDAPQHAFLSAARGDLDVIADDQLRLIFLCCHPSLAVEAQVALSLRLLGGLTTDQIARAFLVPEPTMGQRLSRAKRKIRDTGMPYRVPTHGELEHRLGPVLAMIYIVYTEGHSATSGDDPMRSPLRAEAIRLARVLIELLPGEPEVIGLLALLVLTEARIPARLDRNGDLVPLADQQRNLWDRALIDEGHRLVRSCITLDRPGPYQLQASIAAVHDFAPTFAETDWAQIEALYDHLILIRNHPIVALNRAIAVMEHRGADAALAELESVDLANYHLFHATRGEALSRIGRPDQAVLAIRAAIELTSNAAERRHLERRLTEFTAATGKIS
jgi:RNA polymerase sigma-70 factor (ECF subfamily)